MRNFEVQIWVGGNLALMHMRNLECAIAVFAKLRGCSWKLRGCFFVVWVWCVRWLRFLFIPRFLSFRLLCIWGTFVGAKELKVVHFLGFVYIFRLSVGVFAV